MSQKTWGGRFTVSTDKRVELFTESISFDQRLYKHDIRASQAHARMLGEVGLLTNDEAKKICEALNEIGETIEAGKMEFRIELEDIHTHIERALIERLGDLGRKLHTGRSRNDQVVTDVKLWTREAIDQLDKDLAEVQKAFLVLAEKSKDLVLPGYTHMQRAQPILAAHYCLAYVEKFQRDRDRLQDCRKRVNILPLGAAALAGTSLPIDRHSVAAQLEFAEVARNSLDVSSDRDFTLEFLYCLSNIAIHLSSWAEEWIFWASTEFDFLILPDAFCTGSSIMPHKKNPDVLELTRGKTGRVIGHLQHMFITLKGLPMAYNRDLQEDKPALFDSFDTVSLSLQVAAPMIVETLFKADRITARLEDGFLDATTLMEYFISKGVPMRSAHEAIGNLVRECESRKCRLAELPVEKFEDILPGHGPGVFALLGVQKSLTSFRSYGSTSPTEVQKQLDYWNELFQAPVESKPETSAKLKKRKKK
ncbi:argininosuccinate lyase [Telmatocola sphagniphila]|uniref:Argininosuccinate lyase n=1 Tax=Telmatocola sphagniphila TaxID=1123043 RepID=A0A8E6B9D6_9BACT|nr:argininosuccinate lyase [Telmatocola sphagniphila]QVL33699.1 argininosuccinate lyase [Telmatocola sphagniphila]